MSNTEKWIVPRPLYWKIQGKWQMAGMEMLNGWWGGLNENKLTPVSSWWVVRAGFGGMVLLEVWHWKWTLRFQNQTPRPLPLCLCLLPVDQVVAFSFCSRSMYAAMIPAMTIKDKPSETVCKFPIKCFPFWGRNFLVTASLHSNRTVTK